MEKLKILIIEDNQGDYVLIEEFLLEEDENISIQHVLTFTAAKNILTDQNFDAVLLDLSLPDNHGEKLVKEIIQLAPSTPVIVLTGYTDKEFGVKTLSLGISDYLLKDSLSGPQLYKSIRYSIERKRINIKLIQSEEKYHSLFDLSPQPMWVYDLENLKFLNVNKAAVRNYGYSQAEFLSMSIKDIRPSEEYEKLKEAIEQRADRDFQISGLFKHKKKNGELIDVDVQSSYIIFEGRKARLILATDVTERMQHIREIENQNEIMREIAWTQSHVVRAPLARIMGLINLLKINVSDQRQPEIIRQINHSAHELDKIVREIVRKTEKVEEKLKI